MWTKEQQLAIDKQKGNILVSASAGSGKTAVLVERIINKVIKYGVDIDRLLVVTFTNASAAELKERLISAIYKAIDKDPSNIFLKKQLANINRASITTIHSFCLEVIRSNFFLLEIDPNVKICDDTQSNILKNKAMESILESEYVNSGSSDFALSVELYKILELFKGKDEEFVESMFKIYSYIQSFPYPFEWLKGQIEKYNIKDSNTDLCNFDFGKEIYNDCLNELKILSERIKEYMTVLESDSDFVKYTEMLNLDLEMVDRCIKCSYSSWDKLYDNLSMIQFSNFPRNKVSNEILREELKSLRDKYVKATVNRVKDNIYAKSIDISSELVSSYKYLEYFYQFLIKFDSVYSELKKESGYIDFNDIEHLALKLLIDRKIDDNGNEIFEFTEVAKKYQEKFVEVYTDEYQDTSFVQETILEAVSGSKDRFMVGDIKQSIYKFRQAMPEIFNSKYEKYNLLENIECNDYYSSEEDSKEYKIILAKNFRSRKNVLDSINYIFSQIMSKENGECDYSDIEELKYGAESYVENDSNDYSTEVNILELKDVEEESSNSTDATEDEPSNFEAKEYIKELKKFEIESIYIAKKIKELVEPNGFKVYDLKKSSFRDARYKDIVILLRNIKDKGNILEKTLKENGIPAFSDSSTNLFDSDEIKCVMSFLQVLDNPLQDIPLVSIMYSIIGKFTLDELSQIHEYAKNDYLYNALLLVSQNKEDNLYEKVNYFLKLLDKFKSYLKMYSIAELLIRLYKETNIYYQFSLLQNSKECKANLDSLIQIAVKYESMGMRSLYSYISYIDKLKNKTSADTSTAKLIGENEDVVRIMTIHKSKGLEFPIVILSDTSTKYNTLDLSSDVILHHKLGIGVNFVNEDYMITYPSVIKQAIKNIALKEIKSEELRMLYVALTRAKEKLIIFTTIKDYETLYNNQFVMYKDNKLDPIVVEKNTTYFQNILMALRKYINECGNNIYKINHINVLNKEELENISSITSSNNQNNSLCTFEEKIENIDLKDIDKQKLEAYFNRISENLNFKYRYSEDVKSETRVSVSELKKNKNSEEQDILSYNSKHEDEETVLKQPECLSKDKKVYTSVRKGTLIHFILEHLDLKILKTKKDIAEYILKLIDKGTIRKEDAEQINVDSIFNFLNSKIGNELRETESENIFREEQFVLKDKNISNSTIQGVIDIYYINKEGNIVLVDFKTDKLYVEDQYVSRYRTQLEIYKSALEKLTKKKVDKMYIYSFNINKEIQV